MKRKYKNKIFLLVIIIALLLDLFFLRINNIFLLLGLIALLVNLKSYKKKRIEKKETIIFSVVVLILLLSFYYILGLFNSYEVNYAFVFGKYIKFIDVIVITLVVVVSELIRPLVIEKLNKEDKKRKLNLILLVIIYVLIDMVISIKVQSYGSIKQFYILIGNVLFPSISKNILLTFLVKNNNVKSSLLYRLINDLYVYFIPIVPAFNMYYESVLLIVIPYIYYCLYSLFFIKKGFKELKKEKSIKNKVLNIVFLLVVIVFTGLISGAFKHFVVSIGSESMKGTIDKGDVVVVRKVNPKELKKDQIIVFEKNGTTFVHRIHEVYTDDIKAMFITKGDANKVRDMWVVYEEDIKGVVEFKIKYLGYPSVWLNERFN